MAASNYDDALRRLLLHEGGYTNHPADPGGPTKFGITIYDYRKYIKPGASAADVRAMTVADAKAIYRAEYWDAQRCDELPAGLDYAIFDYGVNSGTGRSGKVLRRVLNLPDNASVVNDAVVAASRVADAKSLVVAICDERLRFLQSLRTWNVFGAGWGRRVADVKAVALAMASGAPSPDLARSTAMGRGTVLVSKSAQQASAGAIVVAGVSAASHAHRSGTAPEAVIGIAGGALLIAAAAWLFWNWRRRRQQMRPA